MPLAFVLFRPKIYHPDSLISGGNNDGLLKFWSLREDALVKRDHCDATMGGSTSPTLFSCNEKASGKDTIDVLAGKFIISELTDSFTSYQSISLSKLFRAQW